MTEEGGNQVMAGRGRCQVMTIRKGKLVIVILPGHTPA